MKKLLALLLALAMVFGCCGCQMATDEKDDRSAATEKTEPVTEPTEETQPEIPLGNEVGFRCYGKAVPVLTADGLTDKTIDPTQTGMVTVINFWGTWCNPCVMELPHFDAVATEYAGKVTVVAIHSYDMRNNAPGFIAKHYPDSDIIFSWDDAVETQYGDYYYTLGNPGFYPYTLILDADGVITATFNEAINYDTLTTAIENAMN